MAEIGYRNWNGGTLEQEGLERENWEPGAWAQENWEQGVWAQESSERDSWEHISWQKGRWNQSSLIIIQVWNHASFLMGICGNIFLLYATVSHRALKLDKMSIWIVQNLAVADLLNCVFVLGTVLVSYDSGRRWVFGEGMCTLAALFFDAPLLANIVLLCTLSVNKLARCWFPFRFMVVSKRERLTISAVSVFLSLIPAFHKIWVVYVAGFYRPDFFYQDGICRLQSNRKPKGNKPVIYALYIICICNIGSAVILVATNICLVIFASLKSTEERGLNRRTLLVLVVVSAAFVSSMVPTVALRIPQIISKRNINPNHRAMAFFWSFLSSWINPFIHLASSSSLREFAGRCLRRMFRRPRNIRIVPATNEMV